mmetsp:Transcript_5372/g.20298  ORF Transcript_5372/g.20298 Transcript_5372/m.20298 type:complete len:205 (+) Transcript_5372:1565-2179(+)
MRTLLGAVTSALPCSDPSCCGVPFTTGAVESVLTRSDIPSLVSSSRLLVKAALIALMVFLNNEDLLLAEGWLPLNGLIHAFGAGTTAVRGSPNSEPAPTLSRGCPPPSVPRPSAPRSSAAGTMFKEGAPPPASRLPGSSLRFEERAAAGALCSEERATAGSVCSEVALLRSVWVRNTIPNGVCWSSAAGLPTNLPLASDRWMAS